MSEPTGNVDKFEAFKAFALQKYPQVRAPENVRVKEDIERLEKDLTEEKIAKLHKVDPSLVCKVKLLWSMLHDWWTGSYKGLPWGTITSVLLALVYFIDPWDVVPEFIPGLGQLDDAALLALVYSGVEYDINQYKAWLQEQGKEVC